VIDPQAAHRAERVVNAAPVGWIDRLDSVATAWKQTDVA